MSEGKKSGGFFSRVFGGATPDTGAKTEEPPVDNPEASKADYQPTPDAEPAPAEIPQEASAASETEQPEDAPASDDGQGGWFSRLKSGLSRTSSRLTGGVAGIFTKRKLDDDTLQDLEDLLIQADLGVAVASRITDKLAEDRYDKEISPEEVNAVLAEEISRVLEPVAHPLTLEPRDGPTVILMVGVNGSGKTTTIGKLARKFRDEGRSVMLAAGDTFRAAAVEQLKVWGERTGTEVITRDVGADAAGLAFDALTRAHETNTDILLIDTAGRLQNKDDLMSELAKIRRVLEKQDATAPHHVLLVLDGTTGQNALSQVDVFGKTAGVTGLVMTKLDGTARGGILVAIAEKFGLPVHAIGVGEAIEDLQPFEASEFAAAIVGPVQT
ncbi:MAG: signal recognition particle-docking protein FtsY [Pseudomonadota bacterium]